MGISERKARLFRQREQDILRAAGDLAERGDWRTVTIDEIARRAEIGKGTVYHHFRCKEEIWARLAIHQAKRLLGRLRERGPPASLPDRLRALIDEAWRFRRDRPEWVGLIHYCRQPAVWAVLSDSIREEFFIVAEALGGVMAPLIGEVAEGKPAESATPSYGTAAAWSAILGLDLPHGPPLAAEGGAHAGSAPEAQSGDDRAGFADYMTAFVLAGWKEGPAAVRIANPAPADRLKS